MIQEVTFSQLNDTFITWSAYDSECKTDVFSCAFKRQKRLILIDPIEPSPDCEEQIIQSGTPALIILTNSNHQRSTEYWRNKYNIPLAASALAVKELTIKPEVVLEDLKQLHSLEPISLSGGTPGETALYHKESKTMILGDAVINLSDTGFSFLPEKYCQNQQELKESLTKLLAYSFETLILAHGVPLTDNPKDQLEKLLSS